MHPSFRRPSLTACAFGVGASGMGGPAYMLTWPALLVVGLAMLLQLVPDPSVLVDSLHTVTLPVPEAIQQPALLHMLRLQVDLLAAGFFGGFVNLTYAAPTGISHTAWFRRVLCSAFIGNYVPLALAYLVRFDQPDGFLVACAAFFFGYMGERGMTRLERKASAAIDQATIPGSGSEAGHINPDA